MNELLPPSLDAVELIISIRIKIQRPIEIGEREVATFTGTWSDFVEKLARLELDE